MIPVECQNLTKTFRAFRAVDSINLHVKEGSIYGLLGPNGAGKTTALKMMMNILPPTSGSARIFGRDSRALSAPDFTRIGYVSENQSVPEWMTVGFLMTYLKPFYPTWDDARASELLRQFDLPRSRKIGDLSRGMWMKASLASSLAYRPRLLVMDEPFSGLDPLVRDELIQGILESAQETTILVSSHDLAEIETFASHIGYMDGGRLHFSEEMSALSARFREVEVTLDLPPDPPGVTWPAQWLRPELAPSLVRFVDTGFDASETPIEIRRRFEQVRDITAHPMPLRDIFLTLARDSAQSRKEARGEVRV